MFRKGTTQAGRERLEAAYFRALFENSNEAIFIIQPDQDRVVDANAQACDMLEYSHEEILTTTISAIHTNEMPKLLAFARKRP